VLLESAIAQLRTLDRPYTILWLTVDKALVVKVFPTHLIASKCMSMINFPPYEIGIGYHCSCSRSIPLQDSYRLITMLGHIL
jgi:hypothetical protein